MADSTHSISVSALARSASDPAFAAFAVSLAARADSFADFALSRAFAAFCRIFSASASAASCCARASSRSLSALLSASFSCLRQAVGVPKHHTKLGAKLCYYKTTRQMVVRSKLYKFLVVIVCESVFLWTQMLVIYMAD